MKTILVVNGESYWQDFFPDHRVVQKRIQTTEWVLRQGELYAIDAEGAVQPDGILWRVGAIVPDASHQTALRLIQLAGIPCVNEAATLLEGYDRLSMLGALQRLGLPVLPFEVVTRATYLDQVALPMPFVVKVGNYHGGYGKMRINTPEQWQDVRDVLFVTNDYSTVEPFVAYVKDLRYLAIGDQVWGMERSATHWKVNVGTHCIQRFEAEPEWVKKAQQVRRAIGADIVALDVLENTEGERFVLEYNDIPGLTGFPDALRYELAGILLEKMKG